jgi:hypothetical protein
MLPAHIYENSYETSSSWIFIYSLCSGYTIIEG